MVIKEWHRSPAQHNHHTTKWPDYFLHGCLIPLLMEWDPLNLELQSPPTGHLGLVAALYLCRTELPEGETDLCFCCLAAFTSTAFNLWRSSSDRGLHGSPTQHSHSRENYLDYSSHGLPSLLLPTRLGLLIWTPAQLPCSHLSTLVRGSSAVLWGGNPSDNPLPLCHCSCNGTTLTPLGRGKNKGSSCCAATCSTLQPL